jgi:RimJ/RimL family protein N-acetyltransferase
MQDENVYLIGARVTIRPLRRVDLDIMSAWSPFRSPLDRLFDWPKRSALENEIWFGLLLRDNSRVYYAVENEHQALIGRISLRGIRPTESARLGIGFGAGFVGQGYGTESLRLFLRYYFTSLDFERMVLDVAAINRRAVRSYERCGFRYLGSHYQYAGTDRDLEFLQEQRYWHLRRFFKREGHRNLMLFYDMILERDEWLAANSIDPAIAVPS